MIIIPGIYNAQTHIPGGNVQGQVITVGAILKVTERDRRPYPSDPGTPSEIWIDNTAAIGYVCKEIGPNGTVWDRLDVLGDYIAFGDSNPGPNADILWGYRPGSLRYARNTQTLWICDDNTQGAAIWSVLGAGGGTISLETNGIPNGDQTLLNIVQGANMLITDDGFGNITFDATGGGGTYTVNNGLTENPVGNFQLGSTTSGGAPLLHDTYIDTVVNHTLYLEGQKTNNNDYILAVSNSVSGGAGILATTVGSGNAIRATSGSSSAISANSSGAPAITASTGGANAAGLFFNTDSGTNNISQGIKLWHTTSGVPAPGFGISLDYFGETISNSDLKLGRLIYQWTDPITISRTSKFQLETVNLNAAAIKLEVDGPGQLTLNEYTTGTSFASVSGTSVGVLNVDSAGKVFVGAGGGGGGSGSILHGTAAGTDTYTVTITGATAYADGDAYLIRFTNGNTTSCTLNISDGVSSFGAVPLYRNNDGQLIGGDIVDGGEMLCIYNSTTNRFQVIGTAPNTLLSYVTNDDTVTLTKGMAVFAFGGTGDRMTVQRASNLGDSTSAQTVGLVLSSSIAPNQKGLIMMQGLLDGLNILPTATWSDGDPVYLGDTPGSITPTKPYAPKHLVYLGVVTTANNGSAGRMYVKVQNGYELDELHNVQAQSPNLNDTLYYDNTVTPAQWKTTNVNTLLNTSVKTGSFGVTVDGVTGVIQIGTVGYVVMPYDGTITGWSITANVSGNIQFDIWKATNAIPTAANTQIPLAANRPKLTAQQYVNSTTLTGWTTSFLANDVYGFYVDSASTIKNATLTIRTTKT
jgi:hypothetical protein